jgi:hypothetical protein
MEKGAKRRWLKSASHPREALILAIWVIKQAN